MTSQVVYPPLLPEPMPDTPVRARRGFWSQFFRIRTLLIASVVIYLGLLIVWPLATLIQGAFAKGSGVVGQTFSDPDVRHAIFLTVLLTIGSVVVNGLCGTIVAWVLVRHNFRGKALLNAIIDLPFAVSSVIAGYMLILLFGNNGWFRGFIDSIHLKITYAVPGMLLVTIFASLPFIIRELMPVLRQTGVEPQQAAYTMGASKWQTFRRVILPDIRWGLLYGIMLTMARSLGEFGAVLVVSGALIGQTETITLVIYRLLGTHGEAEAYFLAVLLGVFCFASLLALDLVRRTSQR